MNNIAVKYAAFTTSRTPSVYYDTLEPMTETGKPWVVLVHGGAHTGHCWLGTPDGRPGWAQDIAARGYRVAVHDWPGSGRSASVPMAALDGETVCRGLAGLIDELDGSIVLVTHSISGAYGWRLIEMRGERLAAVVGVAPGGPGNIQPEPVILSRTANLVELQTSVRWSFDLNAALEPNDSLVRDKLLGASTRFPRQFVDQYQASLQTIAPRLIYERLNIDGSQIKIADTTNFRGKPILITTGEHDADHSREVDGAIANWLEEIGANVEFRFLSDHDINGNGHMVMLEDNSAEISAMIIQWIDDSIG